MRIAVCARNHCASPILGAQPGFDNGGRVIVLKGRVIDTIKACFGIVVLIRDVTMRQIRDAISNNRSSIRGARLRLAQGSHGLFHLRRTLHPAHTIASLFRRQSAASSLDGRS
jgi:hypothetical protein